MSSRLPIWIAALGNVAVVIATIAVLGWDPSAAHAAARNSARFSSLWCAFALASPGLDRLVPNFLSETRLIRAFVAAHAVHYLSVATLLLAFERQHLWQQPGRAAASTAVGLLLLVLLLLTAPATHGVALVVRQATLYLASLIFFLAFVRHSLWPLRAIAFLMVSALAMRLISRRNYRTARARAG